MAYHLTAHLAQNLAVLEQTEYTDPDTGKTKRLSDGATWLKVLLTLCNAAGETDRQFYGGWRYLAAKAGTNIDLAMEKVRLFEQLGWLKVMPPRRAEAGMRGKPSMCWEVTLPNLPALVQDLWQAPPKPTEHVAEVKPIGTAKSKRHRRSNEPVGVGSVLGAVVASVQPIAQQAQPEAQVMPALPKEVAALAQQAKQVLLLKANTDPNLSEPQKLTLVAQAEGSWQVRHRAKQVGKVFEPPLQQVAELHQQGLCNDADVVQWLASPDCTQRSLKEFVGLPEN